MAEGPVHAWNQEQSHSSATGPSCGLISKWSGVEWSAPDLSSPATCPSRHRCWELGGQ